MLLRLAYLAVMNAFAALRLLPRLVEDPPPYRHNQIFRGPRHVLVDIDGFRD